MIGALTVGKKAAKFGYKKYGVPGAVIAGAGGIAGLVVVKKGFKRLAQSGAEEDTPRLESGDSDDSDTDDSGA